MPQVSGKPQDARPLIKASLPNNISAVDKAKLEAYWNEQAAKREAAIALETKTPTEPTRKIRFEIWQYGRHYQAFRFEGKKAIPLLYAPSLYSSAIDAINAQAEREYNV